MSLLAGLSGIGIAAHRRYDDSPTRIDVRKIHCSSHHSGSGRRGGQQS
jgi:hypothetical protein